MKLKSASLIVFALVLSLLLVAGVASAQRRGGFGGSRSFGGGGFSSPRSGGFNSGGSRISGSSSGSSYGGTTSSRYGGSSYGGSSSYGSRGTTSYRYQPRYNQIPPGGISYTSIYVGGRPAYYYPGWGYSWYVGGPIIDYYDPYMGGGYGYGYGGPMIVHTGPSWFTIFFFLFGGVFVLVIFAKMLGGGRGY